MAGIYLTKLVAETTLQELGDILASEV